MTASLNSKRPAYRSNDVNLDSEPFFTMQLSTIATLLLLPFLAVAQDPSSTTTCTSYMTLTKTITLQRAAATGASNGTTLLGSPTPAGQSTGTASAPGSSSTNAGSSLGAANVVLAAVAGAAIAALL